MTTANHSITRRANHVRHSISPIRDNFAKRHTYADKMRKQIVAETIGWARDIYVFHTTGSLPDSTVSESQDINQDLFQDSLPSITALFSF